MPLAPTKAPFISAFVICNREFKPAADGYFHIVSKGEHPGRIVGEDREVLQVIDDEALNTMAKNFRPGLLVDIEHFSMDPDKKSEAAAWVKEVQVRGDGLYATLDLTDLGEGAIKNGRYRFVSPVLELVEIGKNKARPTELLSLALTNKPNLRGLKPLANRGPAWDPNKNKSPASGQNKKGAEMDYKSMLCKLLGLTADATDEQISQAADARAAEVANRKTENDQLKEQVTNLTNELIEADVATYGDLVANRDELKKQLVANRAVTIATLKSLKPATAGGAGFKVLNRADTKTPKGGEGGGDTANKDKEERRAEKVKNRAHQIMKEQKVSFTKAFASADKETGEE